MRGKVIEISPSPSGPPRVRMRTIPNSDAVTGSPALLPDFTGSLRGARMGITSTRSINSGMNISDCVRSMISRYCLYMQRITRDQLTPVFDRHIPPVARVQPREVFWVETEDSRGGRTRIPEHTTPEYLLAMRKRGYHGNPVTGPVFVDSAEPGDT